MSIIFMERRRLFKNLPVTHFKHLSKSTLFITETYSFLFVLFSEDIETILQRCRNLPEVLRKKMSGVLMSEAKKKEGYSLGDLVHIRGKIKIFRGEREVVASYHSILCCNFKPCHMCRY